MTTTRRIAGYTLALAALALFAAVMIIGGRPSTIHPPTVTHTQETPSKADKAMLAKAIKDSGMACHLEYDGPGNGYEAICTPPKGCAKVGDKLMKDCIDLYNRKPETQKNSDGSVISNPAGPALVDECISQYTDYAELMPCLTQPHLK